VGKLIYIVNTSLDGYVEDEKGAIDWTDPGLDVFEFITELVRPMGTYLYGRRVYETMRYWEAPLAEYPPERQGFARIWQAAEKIVFSRTLSGVSTRNTRLEPDFDIEAVRRLKEAAAHDMNIGGAELAGVALGAGLLDEYHLFIHPVAIGGGKRAFTQGIRRELELLGTRRFENGVVHVHHRIRF
jgi:dihydrofolate reductase